MSSYIPGTMVGLPSQYIDEKGSPVSVQWVLANVAAGQTDSSIVAAVTGSVIRVLFFALSPGTTATGTTFNTKPAGAGVAISPLFTVGINTTVPFPFNIHGWFQTTVSQGLTVTTGAGATVGILVGYVAVVPAA